MYDCTETVVTNLCCQWPVSHQHVTKMQKIRNCWQYLQRHTWLAGSNTSTTFNTCSEKKWFDCHGVHQVPQLVFSHWKRLHACVTEKTTQSRLEFCWRVGVSTSVAYPHDCLLGHPSWCIAWKILVRAICTLRTALCSIITDVALGHVISRELSGLSRVGSVM